MVLSDDDVNNIELDMQFISTVSQACIWYFYNSLNWLSTSNWYKYLLDPIYYNLESSVNLELQIDKVNLID